MRTGNEEATVDQPTDPPAAPPRPGDQPASSGKRYVNSDETLELLCVNSGTGALGCDGAPMSIKAAKPLPASDWH